MNVTLTTTENTTDVQEGLGPVDVCVQIVSVSRQLQRKVEVGIIVDNTTTGTCILILYTYNFVYIVVILCMYSNFLLCLFRFR